MGIDCQVTLHFPLTGSVTRLDKTIKQELKAEDKLFAHVVTALTAISGDAANAPTTTQDKVEFTKDGQHVDIVVKVNNSSVKSATVDGDMLDTVSANYIKNHLQTQEIQYKLTSISNASDAARTVLEPRSFAMTSVDDKSSQGSSVIFWYVTIHS